MDQHLLARHASVRWSVLHRSSCLLAGVLASGAPMALSAQTTAPQASPQASNIADIIVTANRRQEAIQSVPVAVTALNAESLREQNISTVSDLLGRVPSLNVSANGAQRESESITIRGQGQTYLAPVGVVNYFAEVPLIQGSIIGNQGGPGTFFDAENLQVLRGPQGTLFGKNTTGGALLIGPARPTNKFEGYVEAQLGNYDDREFRAVVNIPLIDDVLMVRAGYSRVDRDGYTKDVGTSDLPISLPFQTPFFGPVIIPNAGQVLPGGRPNTGQANLAGVSDLRSDFRGRDYDDRHYWTARLGILFRPAEGIENYLVGTYTKSHNNGTGQVLTSMDPSHPSLINLVANAYGNDGTLTPVGFDASDPRIAQALIARQQALGPRRVSLNNDQFYRLKTWAIIDTLSVEISDSLTFRNIIGYQRMEQEYDWDLDGSYLPILNQQPAIVSPQVAARFPELNAGDRAKVTDLSQLTVEPQLQGQVLDDKLIFVIGAFYSKQKPEGLQATGSYNAADYGGSFFDITTRSTALYAQGTVDLGTFAPSLDGLKFTAGVRHTWDKFSGNRIAPNFVLLPVASASERTEATTWTLGLDYQAQNDILVYGKVAKGYKTGNFNYAAPRPTGLTFQPENVMSYEIGAKTDFRLGNVPLRVNIAAYRLDYKNVQRGAGDNVANGCPDPTNPFCNTTGIDQGAITYNIGKARVQGIELEAVVRPLEGFELSGSYSYTNAKYLDYQLLVPADPVSGPQGVTKFGCDGPVAIPQGVNAPLTSVDLSCSPFPYSPKHQLTLSARYSFEIGDAGEVVLNGTYSHASRTWAAPTSLPEGLPSGYLDSYDLFNASVDWNSIAGSSIDARIFVTNLTNTTYRISNSNGDDGSLGYSTSIYNEPRMYGLSIRYRFGN